MPGPWVEACPCFEEETMEQAAPALKLILLPYLLGMRTAVKENAMALGPQAVLGSRTLLPGLAALGAQVETVVIDDQDEPSSEDAAGETGIGVEGFFHGDQMSRMWAQNMRVAREVRGALAEGRLPVGLIGSCGNTIGMVAGLGADRKIGMIWFDAHDDAGTPEDSTSGLIEGMPVAMIAGRCWKAYCAQHEGFRAIDEDLILTIGLHETYDDRLVQRSDLPGARVTPVEMAAAGFEAAVTRALEALRGKVDTVYVHVDVDVLDPGEVRISRYMAHGGLTLEKLHWALGAVAQRFEVRGIDFTSYDPTVQPGSEEKVASTVIEGIRAIAGTRRG